MKTNLLGWLAVAVLAAPSAATAVEIDWVDFSSYTIGASSQAPFTSADGLSVAADFSNITNFAATSPAPLPADVSDPLWPFENTSVSMLTAFGNLLDINSALTFTFENAGGLPAGSSVAVVDLELENSSVAIIGLVNGQQVAVSWTLANYRVAGDNATPPIWDSSTNTLTGPGGVGFPTINNFVFLTSNVALDQVRFLILGGVGDGIGFAVSTDTVPPPAEVPEPDTLALLGLGLAGLLFSRRGKAA